MSDSTDAVVAQIYAYPYETALNANGSRSFQKNHQGLSKLIIIRSENDLSGSPILYTLTATRKEDGQRLTTLLLSKDLRARYTTDDHFLLIVNKTTKEMWGFGTCKDAESAQKTQIFSEKLSGLIRELQSSQLHLQREQSRVQSSLRATSSSITNKQNIDALTAFLPIMEFETVQENDGSSAQIANDTNQKDADRASDGKVKHPVFHSTPTIGQSSVKTHLRIIPAKPAPVANAELADRILSSNLSKHNQAISTDAAAIPASLVFSEKPDPRQTGKDAHYDATVAKLGDLETFPQREEISTSAEEHANPKVSKPFKVRHTQHVSFGRDGFKGVPPEWIKQLQIQFGIPLEQLPGSFISGYTAKIPFVLQVLRDLLIDKGGLETVGIFRLAPQAEHSKMAKEDIDSGLLLSNAAKRDQDGKLLFDYEVHVVSNLIKVWLRDLPTALVQPISPARVETCKSTQEAWDIVNHLPDPYRSVCQYLIDFLSVVSSHSDLNKMPPTNVAICFCPNIFKANDVDPVKSLVFTQQLSKWFASAIQYRIEHPRDDIHDQVDQLAMLYSTESAELLPGPDLPTPKAHLVKKDQNNSLEPTSPIANTENSIKKEDEQNETSSAPTESSIKDGESSHGQ